jgi:cysteinyl-tRNA synthetase
MSRKYLGQPFDIHTGGIDHIPVHHQNEIAQSEAAYGVPLANFWMHSEFVNVASGEKMAKSGENFLTLDSLTLRNIFFEEGVMPLAYRLWLLSAHYRQRLDFSIDAVLAAQTFYKRVLNKIDWSITSGQVNEDYRKRFALGISDDLDTSKALSLVSEVLDNESVRQADKKATLNEFDKVLGLNFEGMAKKLAVHKIPASIQQLSAAREDARRDKDFVHADALREEIRAQGFEVMDTDSGPLLRKKL